jgi:L-amino acid N-acyltransferase YncA
MSNSPTRPVSIRAITEADIPAIRRIYAHHVEHGIATFELTPPSQEEMLSRYHRIHAEGMPYLAACEEDGQLLGYCYASTYRPRPAYRFTVEDSIYLSPDHQGRGIGRQLLQALISHCEAGPWRQMVAVISGEGSEASVALHEKLGFVHSGNLRTVGFKHDRWIDTILMQRTLGAGCNMPPGPALPTPASN